ncbi:MAG: AMP-binding protein, partial [Alcanivoracaceae bacterium]|nr:AMP-binding protein [Alcanivoracaceae bacterium]
MNYRGDSNPDRKQKPGSGGSLLARFEHIAGAHGDRTAVLEASSSTNSPARSYSYAELNQRRLEIAAALQSQHGLEPGDRVGLMQSRRFETIAAMLAIASAGAS